MQSVTNPNIPTHMVSAMASLVLIDRGERKWRAANSNAPFFLSGREANDQKGGMKHLQTFVLTSLLLFFWLSFGWSAGLPATSPSEPLPEVPGVYTELMPSILVRGVDLESLAGTLQPEYVNPSDLPFTITMTGLPVGLRVEDGGILGTPSKKGIYRASIRVGNSYGKSPPAIWVVQVVDESQADFGPGGSFFGVSPVNQSSRFPFDLRIARLQVEVTPAGAFSGSISILGDRRRFTGQLSMNPEDPTERLSVICFTTRVGRVSGVRLTLNQKAKPGFLRKFTAQVGTDDGDTETVWLFPRLQPTDAERKMLLGRQNICLEDQVYSGIAALQCSPGLEANLIGVLPDGTSFTSSSPLVRMETATPGFLVGYDNGKYGNLIGQIEMCGWPEPAARAQVSGVLRWHIVERPGSRALFEGIDVNFQVSGGTYVPPRQGDLLLSGAPKSSGNALLLITGAAFVQQAFTLSPADRAIFPTGAENPFRARLDFYAPAGFFTGQFQVEDMIPGPVSRKLTRQVYFRGLIIQAPNTGSKGCGFFIMASPPDPTTTPPTTLSNSMLLPGGIQLMELNP